MRRLVIVIEIVGGAPGEPFNPIVCQYSIHVYILMKQLNQYTFEAKSKTYDPCQVEKILNFFLKRIIAAPDKIPLFIVSHEITHLKVSM